VDRYVAFPKYCNEEILTLIDIDYMDKYKVFTLGEKFPLNDMRKFIGDLHGNDQHYIVMVDPGSFFSSHQHLKTLTSW
jgi:hypothetical protein